MRGRESFVDSVLVSLQAAECVFLRDLTNEQRNHGLQKNVDFLTPAINVSVRCNWKVKIRLCEPKLSPVNNINQSRLKGVLASSTLSYSLIHTNGLFIIRN